MASTIATIFCMAFSFLCCDLGVTGDLNCILLLQFCAM